MHPLACFVNADIMLTNSFIQALKSVSSAETQFVMTGRRTLLDLDTLWDFDQPNWEDALLRRAKADGKLDDWVAMDYFAFPRGVYDDVPPFVVGRARWDNWMIYSARQRGIAVVDATHDLLAIHQNHDYGHLAGGLKDRFVSPEGRNNQELYGLNTCIGTADATRLLRNGHLRVPLGRASLSRRLDTLPIFNPGLARLLRPLTAVRDFAKSLPRRFQGIGNATAFLNHSESTCRPLWQSRNADAYTILARPYSNHAKRRPLPGCVRCFRL